MEIIATADAVTLATAQNLGFSKFILNRHNYTSSNQVSVLSDTQSRIFAGISPVDSVAPPTIRQNLYRSVPRTFTRRKRRTRRRSLTGGDSEDGEDDGFFGDGGDDGPFGGSGGGGSGGGGGGDGKGWNFGGSNWEEESSSFSNRDPAFDFVYEVLSWIVLSNCIHFAFKKVVRIASVSSIGDPSREKVPMRLVPVC